MNTMTTNEAAKMAADLATSKPDMKMREISKALAKAGYMSFRTGKPISPGGISSMIRKVIAGTIIRDRKPRKHAKVIAGKHSRRSPKRKSDVQETPCTQTAHLPPENKGMWQDLDEANARLVMQKAMEKMLRSLFGVNARVLLPNDVTFRVSN